MAALERACCRVPLPLCQCVCENARAPAVSFLVSRAATCWAAAAERQQRPGASDEQRHSPHRLVRREDREGGVRRCTCEGRCSPPPVCVRVLPAGCCPSHPPAPASRGPDPSQTPRCCVRRLHAGSRRMLPPCRCRPLPLRRLRTLTPHCAASLTPRAHSPMSRPPPLPPSRRRSCSRTDDRCRSCRRRRSTSCTATRTDRRSTARSRRSRSPRRSRDRETPSSPRCSDPSSGSESDTTHARTHARTRSTEQTGRERRDVIDQSGCMLLAVVSDASLLAPLPLFVPPHRRASLCSPLPSRGSPPLVARASSARSSA